MAEADLCLILNGCYDRRSIRQADRNLTPTRTVDVRYKYPAAVVFVPGDKSTIFFRDLDRHPTCFAPVCTSEHCPIRLRPIHHNPLGLDSLGYSIEGKTSWDLMRLVTVYDDVFHPPPWGGFSKLDCSTTETVPRVSHTERYVFGKLSARCFQRSAPTLFQLWRYRPWKHRPRGG